MATTLQEAQATVAHAPRDWTPPVLQPRDGAAERFAARAGFGHPVIVFIGAMLAALASISAVSIALGFLLTRVILHLGGVSGWDEHVNVWLAAHRTPDRT